MRNVLLLAGLMGCGSAAGNTRTAQPETESADNTLGMHINDVQAECRTRSLAELAELDRELGPNCEKQTMPLSISTFDLGTRDGYAEAEDHAAVQADLCICAQSKLCNDQMRDRALRRAQEVLVDNNGKRRREGVTSTMNAAGKCLSATVAAEIWRLGFDCAETQGASSRSIHATQLERYRSVIGADAEAFADQCRASAKP